VVFFFEGIFKPTVRDRFFDDQYSYYLKDSRPKLSPNQRALIVSLATSAIRKLSSYSLNNNGNSSTPLSMRAIGNQFGLSTKAVGELMVSFFFVQFNNYYLLNSPLQFIVNTKEQSCFC
jgi:hypothetical protein